MWLISKCNIDCGHFIEDNDELETKKCARAHGHNYKFIIKINSRALQKFYDRKFIDFALIKRDVVNGIVMKFDHRHLTNEFKIHTVEELVELVKKQIMRFYKFERPKLVNVTVYETEKWGVEV